MNDPFSCLLITFSFFLLPLPFLQPRKVRSKSKAAVEIQRHIRGYFARKKIGHLLAKKVESAVESKDEGKIEEVKEELKDEGLTADEAARY